MNNSRTSRSIKNSIVSLIFYFINLIVQFIARKIFLEYLGAEILGLNTTAQNLLQFLNLAELGIGSAVAYFLYKPLREQNLDAINEIVTLQGILYKRIAIIIIIGAVILLPFFPLIFKKADLPIWYAYASFGAFLFSSLLSYFVNYRQILLTANQQNYTIQYSYQSVVILRSIFQMLAISRFSNPFEWWVIIHIIFSVIGSISLNIATKRAFPDLKRSDKSYRQLSYKYSQITKKIKQIFFHKISGFVLTQSSSLIIYAFASLSLVAYYGNYMMIISGVTLLIQSLFNSIDAGIGNLVAENNKAKTMSVFHELFSLRFLISLSVAVGVYIITPGFINIWIGPQYQLPNSTLLIMSIILYINIFRFTVDSFLNAYGLYSDIYAPIIETILNLGLSIGLGYIWDLNGILSGVLISLLLVVCVWKPYYLFTRGFKEKVSIYMKLYSVHIIIGIIAVLLLFILTNYLNVFHIENNINLILNAGFKLTIFTIILFVLLLILPQGIRVTIKRFFN